MKVSDFINKVSSEVVKVKEIKIENKSNNDFQKIMRKLECIDVNVYVDEDMNIVKENDGPCLCFRYYMSL